MDAPSKSLSQVCQNIGPAERAKRNRVGVVCTALTLLSAAALLETRAAWIWRLTIALPAGMAAMGFLQARAHTCVAFVASNIKVMGDAKSRVDVTSDAERAAFRKKARTIYLQGAAATAVVVGLFLLLP
jgi:hypothetical protein